MRHPSPAARAIRNNPAPTTTAPMARATRSPAGARRSTVMAAPDDRHRAKVHDPDDQEDHHQTGTAAAAVEAEAQAVSPCRAGVGRQRTPSTGRFAAAGEVARLPGGELEEARDQHDHADRDRYGARQRLMLHLDRRQRDAQGKSGHSEHGPDEEVPHTHEHGQPTEARLAGPANRPAITPQHRDQGRQLIATIITTHMPRNDAAAPGQVCPGIRIHAIDIVQPPGIGISPIADMDAHQTIVTAALAAKSSAETPRNACWEARSEPRRAARLLCLSFSTCRGGEAIS